MLGQNVHSRKNNAFNQFCRLGEIQMREGAPFCIFPLSGDTFVFPLDTTHVPCYIAPLSIYIYIQFLGQSLSCLHKPIAPLSCRCCGVAIIWSSLAAPVDQRLLLNLWCFLEELYHSAMQGTAWCFVALWLWVLFFLPVDFL